MRRIGPALLLTALLFAPQGSGAQRPSDEAQSGHGDRFKKAPQNEEERQQARQKIGITVQQQKAIEALFAETAKQEKVIRTRLRSLYNDLQNLYDAYDFDEKQARTVREEIGTQHQNLLTLSASNENKLRRILNRQQFERLRAQMKADRERSWHERHHKEQKNENKP